MSPPVSWSRRALSGWGRFPVVEAEVARPERLVEVTEALQERDDRPLLAHGRSRSYGDAALLEGGRVVLTERLDRILSFDPDTGWVRAESGVTIEDLLRTFVPRGWFVPVVPGTWFVSLGGAIGCDIHGKNHHVAGTISDHVRRLELLTASGDVVTCDAETEPELFWATVGGMGLTGVILAMDLKLVPIESRWCAIETVRTENLEHFFEVSEASKGSTYTMSWIDCLKGGDALGRGQFMHGEHAPAGAEPDGKLVDRLKRVASPLLDTRHIQPNWLLNPLTMAAFNEVFFRMHPRGARQTTVSYQEFFFPLDFVKNWNHLYGRRGMLQYQLAVPPDPDQRALREVLRQVSSSGFASFLAVIKEFGDRDHGGLSFPTAGVTLALDFPNTGQALYDLLDRLDAVVVEAGGRIYLGKDARLGRDTFRRMYPRWEEWRAVRDAWDPKGVFQSELGRRLGLCKR